MNIIEYNKILHPKLCNDILHKVSTTPCTDPCTVLKIPKNSEEWDKIVLYLYKQLLIHIKKFKDTLFLKDLNNTFLIDLDKDMKLDSFHLVKYHSDVERTVLDYNKQLSRFNILTFVFFLEDIPDFVAITIKGKEVNIYSEKGKLVFLQETLDYQYTYHVPKGSYSVITGQITLKNRV